MVSYMKPETSRHGFESGFETLFTPFPFLNSAIFSFFVFLSLFLFFLLFISLLFSIIFSSFFCIVSFLLLSHFLYENPIRLSCIRESSLLPEYLSCKAVLMLVSVGRTLHYTYMFLIVRRITPWSHPSTVTVSKRLALTEDAGIKDLTLVSRFDYRKAYHCQCCGSTQWLSKGIWSPSFSFFAECVDISYKWTRIFAVSCMCHFQIWHIVWVKYCAQTFGLYAYTLPGAW